MRIVVQIPCFNEQDTVGQVIREVREALAAYDDVLILIIDDGSTDRTIEVARKAGADYVARHHTNHGLARGFMTGIAASLNLGADIIVHTDADNQYKSDNIPRLVTPILEKSADIVIGARPIDDIEHFSALKKRLQRLGSWTARMLSGTQVQDATSGFRAYSRTAALRLNTFSEYTYTLETLIQAGRSGLRVLSVDTETNGPTRPSRLISSMWRYIFRSTLDMFNVFTIYAPMKAYALMALVPFTLAVLLGIRYAALVLFFDPTRSHAPSLILAAVLAIIAFGLWCVAIFGRLLSINRRLLEELRIRQRDADAETGRVLGRSEFELIDLRSPRKTASRKTKAAK